MTTMAAQTGLDCTLTALADPTRRAILERLARGEARVTELADPLPMSLNGVSKHIRVLERAQLVQRRRAGREHFLSLNAQPLDEVAAWVAGQRAAWSARLDALAAILRAEDAATAAAKAGKGSGLKRKRATRRKA
jgi:DNA-binding transcriptional ArsR family regulator